MATENGTHILYGHVQDAVADRIREMILSGMVEPGEWLRQDELANTLGVSTMPIREALRQLQAEGLVTFQPRRGACVTKLSVSHHEEIYRIRLELEILACQWAAKDFDRIPLDRLEHLLDEIEIADKESNFPRRLELVRAFFFTIFGASQKEHLLRILSNVWDLSQQYRRYFAALPETSARRMVDYRRVYSACAARDAHALTQAIRDIHAFGEAQITPLLRNFERHE
jgi:DNA-binding GntR family transcriptional regulator